MQGLKEGSKLEAIINNPEEILIGSLDQWGNKGEGCEK